MRLPATLIPYGVPAVLPPALRPRSDRLRRDQSTARSGRDVGSSSITSAARGGPQGAIRARIRTPNVFQGRTVTIADSSRPAAASTIAAANPVRRPCLGVGRHQQLGDAAVDRLGLGEPEQHLGAARHGLNQQAVVDHQECVVGSWGGVAVRLEQQAQPAGGAHPSGRGGGLFGRRRSGAMTAEPSPLNFGRGNLSPLYEPQCRTG